MRSKFRLLLCISLAWALLSPIVPAIQARQTVQANAQAFEPLINRIREALKLSDEQAGLLRGILAAHGPRLIELRARAQTNPFAPGLQADVEKEQREIREELSALLDEEQKSKFAGVDTRPLVPLRPPFVAVNIPPRVRPEGDSSKLAPVEHLIPVSAVSSKGRVARLADDQRVLHVLNRITFGLRPQDFARIKEMTLDRFIEEQLHPEVIDDSELEKSLAVLPTQRMASAELYQFYPPVQVADQRASDKNAPPIFGRPQQIVGELVQQKLVRAVSSNRQLQEVLTDFWFNHFNVFAQKEADQWFVTSYERDVIRPRVLGKFRDLLLATAQSPAMMFYLDNWLSSSPDSKQPRPPGPTRLQNAQPPKSAPGANATPPPEAVMRNGSVDPDTAMIAKKDGAQNSQPPAPNPIRRKPGINENYARELMELHTLGVNGGYTQKDVQEVARCFTGWTIDRPYQGGGFVFRPWMHDDGAKTVLGVTIPAGGGITDGLRVIDILVRQPSTARFISKKLCQRFVSDDPPAPLIERVAQVFLKTDGDLREVVRAILTSAEFNSTAAFRSKVKSPLELAASAIRAVDGDTNGAPPLHEWIRRMGEPLYQFAFPTGYGEDSAKWVNTGVFFNRINYAMALANNQIQGTSYEPGRLVATELAANRERVTDLLTAVIIHTELSVESRNAVLSGIGNAEASLQPAPRRKPKQPVALPADAKNATVKAAQPGAEIRERIAEALGLILGTTEFQRR